MSVDHSYERFAFSLFRKLWIRNGLPDYAEKVPDYPVVEDLVCPDVFCDTVFAFQCLSSSFFEEFCEKDYDAFAHSRSDFYHYLASNILSHRGECYHLAFVTVSLAIVAAEMGIACARRNNDIFVFTCPLAFAMVFEEILGPCFESVGYVAAWTEIYCFGMDSYIRQVAAIVGRSASLRRELIYRLHLLRIELHGKCPETLLDLLPQVTQKGALMDVSKLPTERLSVKYIAALKFPWFLSECLNKFVVYMAPLYAENFIRRNDFLRKCIFQEIASQCEIKDKEYQKDFFALYEESVFGNRAEIPPQPEKISVSSSAQELHDLDPNFMVSREMQVDDRDTDNRDAACRPEKLSGFSKYRHPPGYYGLESRDNKHTPEEHSGIVSADWFEDVQSNALMESHSKIEEKMKEGYGGKSSRTLDIFYKLRDMTDSHVSVDAVENSNLPQSPSASERKDQEVSIDTSVSGLKDQEVPIDTRCSEPKDQEVSKDASVSELKDQRVIIETRASELEDREVAIDIRASELEDQEVAIKTSASELEDQEVAVKTSASELEDQEVAIKTSASELKDQEVAIKTSALELKNQEVAIDSITSILIKDQEVTIDKSASELKDQVISTSTTFELKDPEISDDVNRENSDVKNRGISISSKLNGLVGVLDTGPFELIDQAVETDNFENSNFTASEIRGQKIFADESASECKDEGILSTIDDPVSGKEPVDFEALNKNSSQSTSMVKDISDEETLFHDCQTLVFDFFCEQYLKLDNKAAFGDSNTLKPYDSEVFDKNCLKSEEVLNEPVSSDHSPIRDLYLIKPPEEAKIQSSPETSSHSSADSICTVISVETYRLKMADRNSEDQSKTKSPSESQEARSLQRKLAEDDELNDYKNPLNYKSVKTPSPECLVKDVETVSREKTDSDPKQKEANVISPQVQKSPSRDKQGKSSQIEGDRCELFEGKSGVINEEEDKSAKGGKKRQNKRLKKNNKVDTDGKETEEPTIVENGPEKPEIIESDEYQLILVMGVAFEKPIKREGGFMDRITIKSF